MRPRIVGVIGAGELPVELYHTAELIGRKVAACQAVRLTGGLTDAMEAASEGAKAAGGLTIGILPGLWSQEANPYIALPIVTGSSEARNLILVRTTEVLIAVGGGSGTLSEIAFALKLHKPIISLESWQIADDIIRAHTPQDAVARACALPESRCPQGL